MTQGVDEAWERAPSNVLSAGGVKFVVRYLSYDTTGKNLTAAEAKTLSGAGLSIVSNWEYGAQAAKYGYSQGMRDAAEAEKQHLACGAPADRPIYFSVDYDVPDMAPAKSDPAAKLGPVADYFRGVAMVLGLARTGAYGGYWAISRLFDAGLIKWGWQTYAWSGGRWDGRAQLHQTQNNIVIGGAHVDRDEAEVPDFGQWRVGTPAPTPAPTGDSIMTHLPTLNQGAKGDAVRVLQALLNLRGAHLDVDGDDGPLTTEAVKRYQAATHIAVDGSCGPHTWSMLLLGRDYG